MIPGHLVGRMQQVADSRRFLSSVRHPRHNGATRRPRPVGGAVAPSLTHRCPQELSNRAPSTTCCEGRADRAPDGIVAMVEVDDALRALGGVARWKQLRGHVSWRALRRARSAGTASHVNGTWSLVGTGRARAAAVEMRGVRSHRAAAEHWGFALPPADDRRLDVTVPRKAKRANIPDDVRLHFRDYPPTELDEDVTTALTTVVDCLRDLPLRDALSVGDSALRSGLIGRRALERAAAGLRGPGSRRTRDRVRPARRPRRQRLRVQRPGSPDSGGAARFPAAGQHPAPGTVDRPGRPRRPGAARRRSSATGSRPTAAGTPFARDAVRHTWLVSAGWRPLRLTWYQVMHQPDWVLERVLRHGGGRGADTVAVERRPKTPDSAA